jgi:uncharacterized protein (TIGR00255 family)
MIKSMTGFASDAEETDAGSVSVTIRSVNHRHLDLQMRLPTLLAEHETRLRGLVQRSIGRGRVEVGVQVHLRRAPAVDIELNEAVVTALERAMARARSLGIVEGVLGPADLLRVPQALTIREVPGEPDATTPVVLAAVERTLEKALAGLDEMRSREGDHLRADLDGRRKRVRELLDEIRAAAAQGSADLQARLQKRIAEISGETGAEPAAIAQEVVRFVNRSDISEEIVRFHGHLAHWQLLADGDEPCGRKLDFLLQEMTREINTLGAKAEGSGVPERVVAVKAEIERMREQVQNVE